MHRIDSIKFQCLCISTASCYTSTHSSALHAASLYIRGGATPGLKGRCAAGFRCALNQHS